MDDTPAIEAALPAQALPAATAAVNGSAERRDYRPGYEIVAERILEYIAEERLVAGDRLPTEIALAQTLNTSRAVVREAVKILSALGRVRAHKGGACSSRTTKACSSPAVGEVSSAPSTSTTC